MSYIYMREILRVEGHRRQQAPNCKDMACEEGWVQPLFKKCNLSLEFE